jgi:hypothetical protein
MSVACRAEFAGYYGPKLTDLLDFVKLFCGEKGFVQVFGNQEMIPARFP